ncbi:MAG: CYTH domain-containing protein, partial [Candidatus Helarchaeota archaeon]
NYRLTKKDQLLRIRTEEDLDTHTFKGGEFSWKSGRKGERYEVRKDISVPLGSLETIYLLERLLERLGFRKLACLIKYRDRWKLGRIEFEFDKNIKAQTINKPQKDIGSYLQATIETNENLDTIIEEQLWDALYNLGFEQAHLVKESYLELYFLQLNASKNSSF